MSESKLPAAKNKQPVAGGMPRSTRMRITELNPHLMCALCSGYLVDATTIVECFHSYCRACIVKYLEKERKCPICDYKVNKAKPYLNLRSDKTLQNLVYKVIPNLFKDEMKRRKTFYSDNSQASTSKSTPPPDASSNKMETDAGGNSFTIFSNDEHISLSLEYFLPTTKITNTTDGNSTNSGSNGDNQTKKRGNGDSHVSEELVDKRYLRCPAAVSVSHIKKFIRHKFSLPTSYQIEIMHKDGGDAALRDEYTLMDIAYISNWKRNCQLQLLYRVYEPPNKRLKLATVTSHKVNSPTIPRVPKPCENSKAMSSSAARNSPQTSKDSTNVTDEPVLMVS